jgi:hypothetical protein
VGKKLITLSLVTFFVGLLAVVSHIHVITWNFPDEFTGWVKVQFEDRDCGTETNSHWPFKSVTVRVGKSGTGCSPDSFPAGWTYDKYVYLKPDGRRVPISSESPGRTGLPLGYSFEKKTYILFVGTESEQNNSWHLEPK